MKWQTEIAKVARATELAGLVGYASACRNANSEMEAERACWLAKEAATVALGHVRFWRQSMPHNSGLAMIESRAQACVDECERIGPWLCPAEEAA